jgi:hypothetical protein
MKKDKISEQAREFEIGLMEIEILAFKGSLRDEAMKAYRKLLVASEGKRTYFVQHS